MLVEDLINLMWSALQVKKGSDAFFSEIEKNLSKKIYKIKDEEFQTLIDCVTNEQFSPEFAHKFMKIVLKVISEKKDNFALRTLVLIIWSLAKMDL